MANRNTIYRDLSFKKKGGNVKTNKRGVNEKKKTRKKNAEGRKVKGSKWYLKFQV